MQSGGLFPVTALTQGHVHAMPLLRRFFSRPRSLQLLKAVGPTASEAEPVMKATRLKDLENFHN